MPSQCKSRWCLASGISLVLTPDVPTPDGRLSPKPLSAKPDALNNLRPQALGRAVGDMLAAGGVWIDYGFALRVGDCRDELGALLVAAGLGPPLEHALISLLALNGLRVSEATGGDIEHLGPEHGHRTLTITRKGGKVVTIPLAPRTARAIGLAIGERTEGPVFLAADGSRLDQHAAGRIVRRTARRAGIAKLITPHTLRHAFITAAQGHGVASDASMMRQREQNHSDEGRCHYRPVVPLTHSAWLVNRSVPVSTPGSRCAMSRRPPRTRTRGPRCGMTGPAAAWTGTPPTSSPPTSQAPSGSQGRHRSWRRKPPGKAGLVSHQEMITRRYPKREREPPDTKLGPGGRAADPDLNGGEGA
jgi:integrase-like protein